MSSKNPERRRINQHLWTHHQRAGTGELFDRLVQHEELHAQGNEEGYAGSPLHRHEGGSYERVGEVIEHEGEGT